MNVEQVIILISASTKVNISKNFVKFNLSCAFYLVLFYMTEHINNPHPSPSGHYCNISLREIILKTKNPEKSSCYLHYEKATQIRCTLFNNLIPRISACLLSS